MEFGALIEIREKNKKSETSSENESSVYEEAAK